MLCIIIIELTQLTYAAKNIPPTLSNNIHANLIYVRVWESAQHSGHFANLDGNLEPLEKVGKGQGFSSCWLQPPTELSKEAHWLWPDIATGLHSNQLVLVDSVQMGIFLCLLRLSMCCSPAPYFSRFCPAGIAIGVYADGVPHQEFPIRAMGP